MTAVVWVDAEQFVIALLTVNGPTARYCTELPADLADVVPVVRVERIGGGDNGRVTDAPTLDIDCFASTRIAAKLLAAQVRATLAGSGGYTDGSATVSDLRTQSFGWRPYTNTNVRCWGMTVTPILHNH